MRFVLFLFLPCFANAALGNPFAAAGRLEFRDTDGTCSAALIASDIVVTAAHCVSGETVEGVVFRLGDGMQSPPIPAKTVVIHPLYQEFAEQRLRRLRFDIALVRLARPVPKEQAHPFPLADVAEDGEGLFVASWRRGDGPRPRQRRCLTIPAEVPGVVALGCRVQGGESGAPVLRLTETGMELVAIVNSRSRQGTQPVAYAADVRLRIAPLLERLKPSP